MGEFPRGFRRKYGKDNGWFCEDCDRRWCDGWMLEFHHILPTSAGGRDTEENCALLCRECHLKRHLYLRRKGIDHPNSVGLIRERIEEKGLLRDGWVRPKNGWKNPATRPRRKALPSW